MAKTYSITSKYQVTLPQTIRENLNITKHDRVEFTFQDGKAIIQKAPSLDDLQARLHAKFLQSGRQPATQTELKNARQDFYNNGLKW